MFDNLKFRWALIICALFFGLFFSVSSFIYLKTGEKINPPFFLSKKTIDLGLDLKGGLHIILELDEMKLLEKLCKSKLSKGSKSEYKNLLTESEQLSITNSTSILYQLSILAKQKNIKLNKFFSHLSTSSDNSQIIHEINEQKSYSISSILEIMRNRIQEHDQYGLGEPSIQQLGDNRLIVELAGVDDAVRAKEYIQRTADFELTLVKNIDNLLNTLDKIENYRKIKELNVPSLDSIKFTYNSGVFINEEHYLSLMNFLNNQKIKDLIDSNSKLIWDNEPTIISSNEDINSPIKIRQIYLVSRTSAITGGMVKTPKAVMSDFGSTNAGDWVVNLDMNKEGRRKWSQFTGANINRRVAIVLDDKVFMAPFIRDKISSGSTQISGFSNMQEAKDIAGVLKAGELPVPINIVQTNYIGPSLGEDSIEAGTKSMIGSLIIVLIFILSYYRLSGAIANIALLLNLIIVFGVLVSMNAVLTLPGIAGLLLTIGMTIDANVIIFERIREELKNNKLPSQAIRIGYKKAFSTILDANITTLLTAFALSFVGSGPIKGFATTLSVGIICSMFTAIFVTKTILITINPKEKFSI